MNNAAHTSHKSALAAELSDALTPITPSARLAHVAALKDAQGTGLDIRCSTSFGLEDQYITHLIAAAKLPIALFALDTGRLFEQTHDTFARTVVAYPNLNITTYYPDAAELSALVARQGINGFYDSVAARKACCHVRKVAPLARALKGTDIWISGLRQAQSANRAALPVAEYDPAHDVVKLYPIMDMTDDALRAAIAADDIPYNRLHDEGYPSIGCAPCTRAVKSGEPSRAGRWWWENENGEGSAQECGLHVVDGKLVRVKSGQ